MLYSVQEEKRKYMKIKLLVVVGFFSCWSAGQSLEASEQRQPSRMSKALGMITEIKKSGALGYGVEGSVSLVARYKDELRRFDLWKAGQSTDPFSVIQDFPGYVGGRDVFSKGEVFRSPGEERALTYRQILVGQIASHERTIDRALDTRPIYQKMIESVADGENRREAIEAEQEGITARALMIFERLRQPKTLLAIAGTVGLAAFLVYLAKHGTARMFYETPDAITETSILSPKQRFFALFTRHKPKPSVRHELHYNEGEQQEIDEFADTIARNVAKERPLPHALFWGPPGTGKTAMAKEIARTAGADYIVFSANKLLGGSMADAVSSFTKILAYANSSRKKACIVFIDEADSVFGKRRPEGSADIMQRLTNMFLEANEKASGEKICFILASNLPSALSAPVLNRMGRKMKFSVPTEDVRLRILQTYLQKFAPQYQMALDELLLEQLAPLGKLSEGLVGRDLEDAARGAFDKADGEDATELLIEHVMRAVERKRTEGSRMYEDHDAEAYV